MNKQHILDQIKRTAKDNGGKALGRERFEKVTGIKEGEWSGRYWARWSEAVTEAGFAPNQMIASLDSDAIIAIACTALGPQCSAELDCNLIAFPHDGKV